MLRITPLAFITLAAACSAQSLPSAQEQRLFDLVNRERTQAGLEKLAWNDSLAQAARRHAKLLADHRSLSHQFPGEASLAERLSSTGLRFDASAENVALGPGVDNNHDALMQSAGHRANLLDAEYNAIGIGIAEGGGSLYIAETFAHVFPAYSETEFRDAMEASFNRARKANRLVPVNFRSEDRLRASACEPGVNTGTLVRQPPGASQVVLFTISDPERLPASMQEAARAESVKSVGLGVCFRPGAAQGYANFRVIAAFYSID
jgi:hypothetical protein